MTVNAEVAKTTATRKPVVVREFLRYDFTEDEVRDKSKNLALAVQSKTRAQEQQKAAAAQFKERIEANDALIGQLSRDINMGWEMRDVDCRVDYHTPSAGFKRLSRTDTGEIVREVAMQTSELQENLFADPDHEQEDAEASIEEPDDAAVVA